MKKILTIALPLIIVCLAISQTSLAQSNKFAKEQFIVGKDTLNYRFLFPDANSMRKYPLVIFLHGSGERGNDNEAQLKWGVMNFATDQMMAAHPALVIAPQCPEGISWSNLERDDNKKVMNLKASASKPMDLIYALIQKMIKEMPVDTNRIYITGLSMGGYGTFDALMRYPNLFAAAVPVCGGGDVSKAASIKHIPMWIFHGAEDPAVNPQFSVDMLVALNKAGAHPGFTMYPEVGHFSWLQAYTDQLMYEWLFKQHK